MTCFGGVLRFCRLSHVTSEIGPRILGVHGAHIGYANITRPCCQRSVVMESVARGGERLVPWMSLPQSVNSSTACVSHVSIVFIITTPIYRQIQLLHAGAILYMKHESILCRLCPSCRRSCEAPSARAQVRPHRDSKRPLDHPAKSSHFCVPQRMRAWRLCLPNMLGEREDVDEGRG